MKLFKIERDAHIDYVEAKSFDAAVRLWQRTNPVDWGIYSSVKEPDSVVLVHDGEVLRAAEEANPPTPTSAAEEERLRGTITQALLGHTRMTDGSWCCRYAEATRGRRHLEFCPVIEARAAVARLGTLAVERGEA